MTNAPKPKDYAKEASFPEWWNDKMTAIRNAYYPKSKSAAKRVRGS